MSDPNKVIITISRMLKVSKSRLNRLKGLT